MAEEGFKRKLAAILSADVEGYSRLMDDDEEATVRTLTSYRSAITDLVQQYRGRVVDSPGDNILADFTSVVDAVNCAVEIQRDLAERNAELPDNRKMQFRIGVNLGDVIDEDGRIYGDGVNIAARVESLAEAGGICISGRAHDQVENKLGLEYEDLGKHQVKNISRPIQVYRVLSYPGAAAHRVVQAKETLARKWRKISFSAAVIVVVVAALGIWQFYFSRSSIEPATVEKMAYPLPDKPSLAVLPFDNLSGDKDQDYLADGLTENIIDALSKIAEMFVAARHSTLTYKGKQVKISQIAEDLGVQYVLEGSIQKSGERLRVTAQLIDALKGHHVWSQKYDRKLEELFALQDDITLNIAIAMELKLTEGEQARMRQSTDNLEAWSLASKGKGLFENIRLDDNLRAREFFEKAVELDPNYVYAWVYLAWTHFIDGYFFPSRYDQRESFKHATEIAQKALKIDDNLSDAYALLSFAYLTQRKFDEALVAGKKAIALGPNDSENHAIIAIVMQYLGDGEAVINLIKKAMRLDPYFPGWYWFRLAMGNRLLGRYEEAVAILEKRVEVTEKAGKPYFMLYIELAPTYVMMGRMEDARACVTKLLKINPEISIEAWRKSQLYKDPEYTERILEALRKAGLPETPPLPLPDKPSIAVLAFDNLSGDPEQEYFSDGIAENIITALSKVGELFVIARNSSFTYKGKPVKVQQIGRELGVRYVLEGSVQKSGDRVRITSQLIDARNGQHLWAEKYDRELKDIFAVQDDITKRVVSSLQANLTVGEITRAYARGTNSLEAYLKVIKARNIHMRFTKDDNLISRELTQEAIAIDPEYGEAYVLLAATYMLETYFGGEKSPKELMGQAIKYAKKAVDLETVGGHAILGWLYSLIGQIDKALTECNIAVDLDPNSASARTWYGAVLTKAGQYDMAVQELEQALRRDPMAGTWVLRFLGSAYSLNDRHEEAISTLKKAIQKAPKDYLARLLLTRAYVFAGRPDEAQAEAAEVLRLNPDFSLEKHAKRFKAKDTERTINALRQAGLK